MQIACWLRKFSAMQAAQDTDAVVHWPEWSVGRLPWQHVSASCSQTNALSTWFVDIAHS